MRVGETFVVVAKAFGCGGRDELTVDMRWSTSHPEVAMVHELTGRVSAVGIGDAIITGRDLGRYGIGPVQVDVTVLP
jgi:fumarylacetoacetate (FAA) hydrolase family protein